MATYPRLAAEAGWTGQVFIGFIERFNKTVLDAFSRIAVLENFYESVEALQETL